METEMPTVDLEELKLLLAKATPGPWGWGEGVCGPYLDRQAHAPDWSCNDSGREPVWLGGSVLDDDMALIAALRNAAPALIAELEQAESRLREAQADAARRCAEICRELIHAPAAGLSQEVLDAFASCAESIEEEFIAARAAEGEEK